MTRMIQALIQEGQRPGEMTGALESGLKSIFQDFFGDDPAEVHIVWDKIAGGQAFTCHQPSTSSILSFNVPDDIAQERRVELLNAICSFWEEATGCSKDEIVATALNASLAAKVAAG